MIRPYDNKIVRRYLSDNHVTHQKLADETGLSTFIIGRIARGASRVTDTSAKALAPILGVEWHTLVT